jgi:hypothetical protein
MLSRSIVRSISSYSPWRSVSTSGSGTPQANAARALPAVYFVKYNVGKRCRKKLAQVVRANPRRMRALVWPRRFGTDVTADARAAEAHRRSA